MSTRKTGSYRKYSKHSIEELKDLIDDAMKGKKYSKLGVLLSVYEDKCLSEQFNNKCQETAQKLANWLCTSFNKNRYTGAYASLTVFSYYSGNSEDSSNPVWKALMGTAIPYYSDQPQFDHWDRFFPGIPKPF